MFYEPADSLKVWKWRTAMEKVYVALIALSHDMYKYILNKVFY